jgi:multidrug efflux pump
MAKSYLDLLKFNPKQLKSIPGRYLKNIRLMVLLLLVLLVTGVGSLVTLPKTLYPEIEIPYIFVQTVLPGSGPEEIESLITEKIEKEIKTVKGIDTFNSSSIENVSFTFVQFESDVDPDEARDLVQAAVDKVANLPDDATEPSVTQLDFENEPVIDFALVKKTNTQDVASLNRLADKFKDEIETLPRVDRVEMSGLDEREIQIIVKPDQLLEKGLSTPMQLASVLSNALGSYPAGNIVTANSTHAVSIEQPVLSLEEMRDLPLKIDGKTILLKELGEVKETSKLDQAQSYLAQQVSKEEGPQLKPVVFFSVYKTPGERIDLAAQNTQKLVDELMTEYNQDYELKVVQNYSQMIDDQFGDLIGNFYQTILLVFLSMFLLYGVRQAGIASLAVPASLLVVFASMSVLGISLNFLSIFSVLIALGLFVDNAVVIIEGFTSYYKSGKFTPLETALLVWKDFFIELFSINLLTVWAFLPLLITQGIIGEFVKSLPIIVSVAMMGSVAVAVLFTLPSMMLLSDFKVPQRVKSLGVILLVIVGLITPALFLPKSVLFIPTLLLIYVTTLIIWSIRKELSKNWKLITKKLLKNKKQKQLWNKIANFTKYSFNHGLISLDKVADKYRVLVNYLLKSKSARAKMIVMIVIFTLVSYLLVPLGFVKNEFFPKSDTETINIQLELPAGTRTVVTADESKNLLSQMAQTEGVEFATVRVKAANSGMGSVSTPGSNTALFTLKLIDEELRDTSTQIAQNLRNKFADYSKGDIQVLEESGGPPAGADLEIKISGQNLNQLSSYADQVENFLKEIEGTTNYNRSIKNGVSKYVFIPDKNKLSFYGVTEQQIGLWLRTYLSGFNVGESNFDDEFDITLRLSGTEVSPEELSKLEIPTNKDPVAIGNLGKFELQPSPVNIERIDGVRTITVVAAALPGYLPTELNAQLEEFAQNELNLETGYSWSTGGVNQENQESINSIIRAMGISAILILVTMVLQLGSFRKALIVMLVIPLALSGVFIWFALTGTPISFPAMVGMLSLFGIVIANSLMIVDKVSKNLEVGMEFKNAIIDAGATRLEPILLTSASQIIGLIPITLADPLWRGMGGAIIAGLSFSGTIMLLFVPLVYYYFFPELRQAKKKK